jgi:hypothetical protein
MSFGSSVFRGLYGAIGTTTYSQHVVVPIEDVVGAVSKHPDRCIDGERVTSDAYGRLFVCLFGLSRLRCYRDLCAGRDVRIAEAVVVLFEIDLEYSLKDGL